MSKRYCLAFMGLLLLTPSAGAVDLIDYIPAAEQPKLATTGVLADEYLAAALSVGDGEIHLPRGLLLFERTVHLKRRVHLVGEGGGLAGKPVSALSFPADRTGIVVHRVNTGPDGIEPPSTAADGSVIEGVHIQGGGGTSGHGIWLRARATIRQSTIDGFAENCINIVATARTDDKWRIGNANNWIVDTVRLTHCQNGLFVDGADVNAGMGLAVSADANRGYGILDSSFLGNTYVAPHAAGNKSGPYFTDNADARTLFVGAYSESGQPPAQLVHPTTVIGGLHGAGVTGTALRIGDGNLSPTSIVAPLPLPDGTSRELAIRFNKAPGSMLDVVAKGDHPHGWSLAWWNERTGTLEFRHARMDSGVALMLTTDLSTMTDESGAPLGGGKLILNGAWVEAGNGKYRYVKTTDLVKKTAALEAENRALAEKLESLERRLAIIERRASQQ